MSVYSVKSNQIKAINQLWNQAKKNGWPFSERGYVCHDIVEKEAILFIGINPSFSESKSKHENIFINLDQEGKINGKLFPYFKKFPIIANKIKYKWTHCDLLMVRETQQKKVKELYKTHEQFVLRQLSVAKKTIIEADPKIIVVCNAYACELFKKHIFKTTFDPKIGTHVIQNKELKGKIVFYSSMLTGQRALDLGSLERLQWHLRMITSNL